MKVFSFDVVVMPLLSRELSLSLSALPCALVVVPLITRDFSCPFPPRTFLVPVYTIANEQILKRGFTADIQMRPDAADATSFAKSRKVEPRNLSL